MPGWANEDDKMICFFQAATKFKVRYSTFGFDAAAQLDDGDMWATAFALTEAVGRRREEARRPGQEGCGR